MKSIRLSLVVYFLALIAVALGGVSWLAYQTTATTMQEKQASTERLIDEQFKAQCQEVRTALDRRILRQAQLLASKARANLVPNPVFYLASASGVGAGTGSRIVTPLLTAPLTLPWPGGFATGDRLAVHMGFQELPKVFWSPIYEIQIPSFALDFLPSEEDHPVEVFQTYRRNGVLAQRSASLGDKFLTLAPEVRERLEDLEEHFEDIEFEGRKFRCVTWKTNAQTRTPFGPNRYIPFKGNKGSGGNKTALKGNQAPPRPPPANPTNWHPFTFFIQYAADTAPIDEEISEFAKERDARLAESEQETRLALLNLRRRLFWIAILTFVGIVTGGYLLLRLGLAPLSRLSEAVSKVSEKNFELQVDQHKLPSELRPIAQRLRQSLQQLQQAFAREKQAAADISHELRTPLAALMTTLDVAVRKQRTPQEYQEILEECRSSGRHMSLLVERLMALARLDAGVDRPNLETIDVAELAQHCADMVKSLVLEQNLVLQTHLPETLPAVTDAGKLREITLNLLHNAIAYNKPCGSIDLRAERQNGEFMVEVRDTGIGIAPEAKTHLFERFFRADPSRHADTPHCGLGLAIVKSYVDLLGGSIHVQSSPEGSTFQIRLPAGNPESAPLFEEPIEVHVGES